jgi:hypothetical protein
LLLVYVVIKSLVLNKMSKKNADLPSPLRGQEPSK